MPVGEQAAGRSLGTIFYPARHTARFARGQLWHLILRFLPGRGASSQHDGLRIGKSLVWCLHTSFHTHLVMPGETRSPGSEACEVAAASRAAMGSSAETQQESRPARRTIVVRLPPGEFLPVTFGATREHPGPLRPDAGLPSIVAAAAAELRDTQQTLEEFAQPALVGDTYIPCSTDWTG